QENGTAALPTNKPVSVVLPMGSTSNQGFASLVPRDGIDARFLFYLAQAIKSVFVRLAAGTTFVEVSRREIRRVKVCVPADPKERATIGRALTLADEALMAAEAQVTAALRLKSALMQQLFTRGIPGWHATFKQTKIGEIPERWDLPQLRRLLVSSSNGLYVP